MKPYFYTFITLTCFFLSSFGYPQHTLNAVDDDYKDCIVENYQKIELCLIETFSKEWYDDLCEQDKASKHRFYFHIITDTQGNIVSVEKDRLFKGMTEYEFKQFAINFKRNFTICIFPPRGTTLEEFKRKNGNRLPFSFLYFPYKTRTFLEDWRLKNN